MFIKFVLWLILLVICWPLLPFRLVGITVGAVFDLFKAIITLPARILKGPGK